MRHALAVAVVTSALLACASGSLISGISPDSGVCVWWWGGWEGKQMHQKFTKPPPLVGPFDWQHFVGLCAGGAPPPRRAAAPPPRPRPRPTRPDPWEK